MKTWANTASRYAQVECGGRSNTGYAIDDDDEKNTTYVNDADDFTRAKMAICYRGRLHQDNLVWNKVSHEGQPANWQFFVIITKPNRASITETAQLANKYRCGNCDIMVDVALNFLLEKKICALSIIAIGNQHAILVLNMPNLNDNQLQNFNEWGGSWICDPWADIVCRPEEYPQQWIKAMEKWAKQRKKVRVNDQWISPLDEKWLALPNELKKLNIRVEPVTEFCGSGIQDCCSIL